MGGTGHDLAIFAVGFAIGTVFVRGCRHGFAHRHGRRLRHGPARVLLWIVAIAALVTFEAFQFARGATTATSLMVPLLAVPAVRVAAFAFWARLGLELARA